MMKQIERSDVEPYFLEDDLSDEEYNDILEKSDKLISEEDEFFDRVIKDRRLDS